MEDASAAFKQTQTHNNHCKKTQLNCLKHVFFFINQLQLSLPLLLKQHSENIFHPHLDKGSKHRHHEGLKKVLHSCSSQY